MEMPPQDFHDPSLMAHLKRLWFHGFLAGLAVVLAVMAVWYFIWGWPQASAPEGQEEARPAISQTPAAPSAPALPQPSAALRAELEAVLAKLAEAHRHKDLPLLLSLYDPTFPDLPQKTEKISRSWKIYDYRSLRFRIEEIRSLAPDRASARVIWEAETRNRATREIRDLSQTYQVGFSNDSGQWRIHTLEITGRTAAQKKT